MARKCGREGCEGEQECGNKDPSKFVPGSQASGTSPAVLAVLWDRGLSPVRKKEGCVPPLFVSDYVPTRRTGRGVAPRRIATGLPLPRDALARAGEVPSRATAPPPPTSAVVRRCPRFPGQIGLWPAYIRARACLPACLPPRHWCSAVSPAQQHPWRACSHARTHARRPPSRRLTLTNSIATHCCPLPLPPPLPPPNYSWTFDVNATFLAQSLSSTTTAYTFLSLEVTAPIYPVTLQFLHTAGKSFPASAGRDDPFVPLTA